MKKALSAYEYLGELVKSEYAITKVLPKNIWWDEDSDWFKIMDWEKKGRAAKQNHGRWNNAWGDIIIAMNEVLKDDG